MPGEEWELEGGVGVGSTEKVGVPRLFTMRSCVARSLTGIWDMPSLATSLTLSGGLFAESTAGWTAALNGGFGGTLSLGFTALDTG